MLKRFLTSKTIIAKCRPMVFVTLLLSVTLLSLAALSPSASAQSSGVDSYAAGIDTCSGSMWTSTNLQDFWSYSPYWSLGVYLGGSGGASVGCNDSSYLSMVPTAMSMGWAIEPYWYGPQLPYSTCQNQYNYPSTISLDTATAYSQGQTSASHAISAAQAAGLPSNAPIYYDLEQVLSNSGCLAAAQAFISGWDSGLGGYISGLYGSTCGSQLSAFSGISPVPAVIAPADNLDDPTGVYGLQCLSDGLWNSNQRIHQLANTGGGGYQPQTFSYNGSTAITVDEDCIDGWIVANSPGVSPNNCNFYSGNA